MTVNPHRCHGCGFVDELLLFYVKPAFSMNTIEQLLAADNESQRSQRIVQAFIDAFEDMMRNDPDAWRGKFRKMSSTPFAFYRGSAVLFFSDMATLNDTTFLNDQTSRVWIHGDLHAENFGTYMNDKGVLVFDVNDFDEAWVAPFTWDLKRLAASLALICYAKAISDEEIRKVIQTCMHSYAQQVETFASSPETHEFSLNLANTQGPLEQLLKEARLNSRIGLLDSVTEIVDYDRRFKRNKYALELDAAAREKVETAFEQYLETIPQGKLQSMLSYSLKDVVELRATGIGSAGYKMYSMLLEGPNQALENDIIISMKVGQTPSASRIVPNPDIREKFLHNGHRTVLSQRALQAHTDPWIGHTEIDGVGQFVCEYSPYNADLNWDDINKLDDIVDMASYLGQAVAKIHCVSDADSDASVVPFSVDQAIHNAIKGREAEFAGSLTEFGLTYGNIVRDDYRLFVDAFRNHAFPNL